MFQNVLEGSQFWNAVRPRWDQIATELVFWFK